MHTCWLNLCFSWFFRACFEHHPQIPRASGQTALPLSWGGHLAIKDRLSGSPSAEFQCTEEWAEGHPPNEVGGWGWAKNPRCQRFTPHEKITRFPPFLRGFLGRFALAAWIILELSVDFRIQPKEGLVNQTKPVMMWSPVTINDAPLIQSFHPLWTPLGMAWPRNSETWVWVNTSKEAQNWRENQCLTSKKYQSMMARHPWFQFFFPEIQPLTLCGSPPQANEAQRLQDKYLGVFVGMTSGLHQPTRRLELHYQGHHGTLYV